MPSLLRRLNRLEPGGALLFADVMEPRTERARRHFATAWEEIHGDARAHLKAREGRAVLFGGGQGGEHRSLT